MKGRKKKKHMQINDMFWHSKDVFLNQNTINVYEHTVKMAPHDLWCHLCYVFTYNYCLLIGEDLRECWNISLKFGCALICIFHLKSSVFLVRVPVFIPTFESLTSFNIDYIQQTMYKDFVFIWACSYPNISNVVIRFILQLADVQSWWYE